MSREAFLVAIAALSILNGLFSPVLRITFPLVLIFYPGFLPVHPSFLLFATSLLVSTLTIMLAGVPAALYERASAGRVTTEASLWIWLAGVAALSLPAVIGAIGLLR